MFRNFPGTAVAASQEIAFSAETARVAGAPGLPSRFIDEQVTCFYNVPNNTNTWMRRTFRKDFSDGAGHGLLIATDSIFAALNSTATTLTNIADCRLLYRFKEVPLAEYIGIVQSQQ